MADINPNSENSVVRFLFEKHGVRGEIVKLKEPLEDLLAHCHYPHCVNRLMLELTTAATLIAATLKAEGQIMLQLQGGSGNKALKYALCNINRDLSFYGSAALNPHSEYSGNETFEELCGENAALILSVFPKDGSRWQGIVPIEGGSLASSLEQYFERSEQLPSRFFLFADPDRLTAAGLMLQIIPEVANNLDSMEHLAVLASTLKAEELYQQSLYQVLHNLYWDDELIAYKPQRLCFKCSCSKQRCAESLKTLPRAELEDMTKEESLTITCQHCGRQYTFTQPELKQLLLEISQ